MIMMMRNVTQVLFAQQSQVSLLSKRKICNKSPLRSVDNWFIFVWSSSKATQHDFYEYFFNENVPSTGVMNPKHLILAPISCVSGHIESLKLLRYWNSKVCQRSWQSATQIVDLCFSSKPENWLKPLNRTKEQRQLAFDLSANTIDFNNVVFCSNS